MQFEIIDFHTHPFLKEENNICAHKNYCNMSAKETFNVFNNLGVSTICGSVISVREEQQRNNWEYIKKNNDIALELKSFYGNFYIPGFHIHPDYPDESISEIERMDKLGVKLIGELVPYLDGWSNYSTPNFSDLLKEAGRHNMIVSIHSDGNDEMDELVKNHKDIIFVAAHPGEYCDFMRHIERMKMSENYYLDLSGYGLFRHGMLRRAIDCFGADRILFGSDYPICNLGMYIGGVLFDDLISDTEKEKIFSVNAKKLLLI